MPSLMILLLAVLVLSSRETDKQSESHRDADDRPVQTERVDARRRDHIWPILASNVCIFIQLSITSFSVTSLHC